MRVNHVVFAVLAASGLLVVPVSGALAQDMPPTGAEPLSTILQSVENQKLGTVSEAEFDDGVWKVTVGDHGSWQKLYIDPRSGQVKSRKHTSPDSLPPAGAMSASEIAKQVEARNAAAISEIEFERGAWSVKLKAIVNPKTGDATR